MSHVRGDRGHLAAERRSRMPPRPANDQGWFGVAGDKQIDMWSEGRMPIDRPLSRKYRLLVAEDDPALRAMMVALFRADSHEVVAVGNGLDLLDTIEVSLAPALGTKRFDLVISDVRMPEMTGLGVFDRLGYGPTIPPVVFITAFGDEELHREAIQAGARAVLDKPLDLDELRAFVNDLLARECN
jgi:CheY-like chemotaxis protein